MDQPQHECYSCTNHCCFCTLGGWRHNGLALDSTAFRRRSSVELRQAVAKIESLTAIATRSDDRAAKRSAKMEMAKIKSELHTAAYKRTLTNVRHMMRDPHWDFLNCSVSPMHCQKGAYKDTIFWTLQATLQCCHRAQGLAFLRACDVAVVDQVSDFLRGRCKSRGLSGVLTVATMESNGLLGVRSSSKSDLGNAMKILRGLLFYVHDEAFGAHAGSMPGPRCPRRGIDIDDTGANQGPDASYHEVGSSTGDDDGEEDEQDDDERRWHQAGPFVHRRVRVFLHDRISGGFDGRISGYSAASDIQEDAWRITLEERPSSSLVLDEDATVAALYSWVHGCQREPTTARVERWAESAEIEEEEEEEDNDDDDDAGGGEGEGEGEDGGGENDGDSDDDADPTLIKDALDAFYKYMLFLKYNKESETQIRQFQADGHKTRELLKGAFGAKRFAKKKLFHKLLSHAADSWFYLGSPEGQTEETGERELRDAHTAYDLSNGRWWEMIESMTRTLSRQLAWMLLKRQMALTDELLAWLVLEEQPSEIEFLLTHCGADALAKDADGDPVVCVAAASGNFEALHHLLAAAERESRWTLANLVAQRDSDGATALVLASMHGHAQCVQSLLGAGACPTSKWQHLEPIHWAAAFSHTDVVEILEPLTTVVNASVVPHGRSVAPHLIDSRSNRLQPIPARRHKGTEDGSSDHTWAGKLWTSRSILSTLLSEGSKGAIATAYPGLGVLGLALRRYLYGKNLRNPRALSKRVAASVAVRPGIKLRKDASNHRLNVAGSVNATYFGRRTCARQFVALDPGTAGTAFDNWIAELVLCFTCIDDDGVVLELCYVRWLWPSSESFKHNKVTGAYEEVAYHTRYHLRGYEVMDVPSVMHRAPVFEPPHFENAGNRAPTAAGSCTFILADDLYGIF